MGIDCLLAHLLTWELYPVLSTKGYPTYVQPHPSTLGLSIWCFGSETLLTPSTGQGSGIVWQPHCVPWNPHRRVCRQCQLCIQGSSMLKQLFNFLNPCVSRTSHLLLMPKSVGINTVLIQWIPSEVFTLFLGQNIWGLLNPVSWCFQ